MYGYIRARVSNDDDAKDVEQETWLMLWQWRTVYDPTRPFQAFAKYWAWKMLLKHYDAQKRFPQAPVEEDQETQDVTDRLMWRSGQLKKDPLFVNAQYNEFLRRVFNGTSPPHQLIAFGFVKLLEWETRSVVGQLSDDLLRVLQARLEEDYSKVLPHRDTFIRSCFRKLKGDMDRKLDVVIKEPNTREAHQALIDRNPDVGETVFRDYYRKPSDPKDSADRISKWCDAVRRRVLTELGEEQTN